MNIHANPKFVPVAEADGRFFVAASDIERLVESGNIVSIDEAISKIINTNHGDGMTNENTVICMDGSSCYIQDFAESGMMLEASAEDDATNLKKTAKWYNKFISKSKGGTPDKKEVQERINVLKECLRKMESALKNPDDKNMKVKYAAKDLIPFNSVYRLIKRQDGYAGLGWIADMILPGLGIGVRYLTYEKMIEKCIGETKDAIDYLERKLKDM